MFWLRMRSCQRVSDSICVGGGDLYSETVCVVVAVFQDDLGSDQCDFVFYGVSGNRACKLFGGDNLGGALVGCYFNIDVFVGLSAVQCDLCYM